MISSANTEKRIQSEELLKKKPVYEFIKRSFDIVFSVIALVLLFVPLCIVAIIIVIDSPGASPIYVQKRVGKDGKEFKFYKFRSMVPDAEAMLETLLDKNEMIAFKMKEDPRITKFGKIIRRSCVDELPQLINILKGDMSIVGPRPERVEHMETYGQEIPEFDFRTKVKGGLTGYAQIYGKYNTTPYDKLRLDLMYIENYLFVI